jgi:hypothetical protein
MLEACIASLKVAVTLVDTLTPVAFEDGVREMMTGGVVSGPTLVMKTTSTQ